MTSEENKPRQMPKGGRKGGAIFPRLSLKDALIYARKLVSKTHVEAQPRDVILSGVVGAKSGMGNVRMSALKQYGLLKGDDKSNYSADELAKKIVASPPDELVSLYRQAVLKPTVFKRLFDTFHDDAVTKAKLKQRCADLKIHPDETETCVELYVSGMTMAGIVTIEGEKLKHLSSSEIYATAGSAANNEDNPSLSSEFSLHEGSDVIFSSESDENSVSERTNDSKDVEGGTSPIPSMSAPRSGPKAVFNVNVTLDASMDVEKLQKQLELLKRFGAI